jgi:hypothetical protein
MQLGKNSHPRPKVLWCILPKFEASTNTIELLFKVGGMSHIVLYLNLIRNDQDWTKNQNWDR